MAETPNDDSVAVRKGIKLRIDEKIKVFSWSISIFLSYISDCIEGCVNKLPQTVCNDTNVSHEVLILWNFLQIACPIKQKKGARLFSLLVKGLTSRYFAGLSAVPNYCALKTIDEEAVRPSYVKTQCVHSTIGSGRLERMRRPGQSNKGTLTCMTGWCDPPTSRRTGQTHATSVYWAANEDAQTGNTTGAGGFLIRQCTPMDIRIDESVRVLTGETCF